MREYLNTIDMKEVRKYVYRKLRKDSTNLDWLIYNLVTVKKDLTYV